MIARLIPHAIVQVLIVPFGGWLLTGALHLGLAWFIVLDVLAGALIEMALLGSATVFAVGAASLPPVLLAALILPRVVPTPTVGAAVLCAAQLAALAGGAGWYRRRVRRGPAPTFRRAKQSMVCAAVAATAGLTVAGAALHLDRVDGSALAAAVLPAAVWGLALRLRHAAPRLREVALPVPLVPTGGAR